MPEEKVNEEKTVPDQKDIETVKIDEENHLHEGVENDSFSPTSDTKSILILVGITIILFIMIISGFGYYNSVTSAGVVSIDDLHQDNLEGNLDENTEGYVYQGFSFIKAEGLWWTEIDKFGTRLKIPLHFGPKEIEDIELSGNLDPKFNDGDDVYVTIDPKVISEHYTLAISELSFNLVKGMDRVPVGSCTEENEVCEGREIINCETADGRPTVELAISETSGIEFIGTCIKVSGTGWDLVKGVNRVLYHWYGIMN
jgi:hypothetical protein